jgi:hypothetical protein
MARHFGVSGAGGSVQLPFVHIRILYHSRLVATADHFEIDPQLATETAAAAEALAMRIEQGGDNIAWASLEQGLEDYEKETGGSAAELLPADVEPLAFHLGLDRAREFARKVVCGRNADVRAQIEAGIAGGNMALVCVLFAILGLPGIAAEVVAAIAGVLMVRRLEGFCASASTVPA